MPRPRSGWIATAGAMIAIHGEDVPVWTLLIELASEHQNL
jgi:hypothetical protein